MSTTEGTVTRSSIRTRCETISSPGFTVIELLIVVSILAVLASLALGKYSDYREKIRVNQAVTEVGALSELVGAQFLSEAVGPPAVVLAVECDLAGRVVAQGSRSHDGVRGARDLARSRVPVSRAGDPGAR